MNKVPFWDKNKEFAQESMFIVERFLSHLTFKEHLS